MNKIRKLAKAAAVVALAFLSGCATPYTRLNQAYSEGRITREEYVSMWQAQQAQVREAALQAQRNIAEQTRQNQEQPNRQAEQNQAQYQAIVGSIVNANPPTLQPSGQSLFPAQARQPETRLPSSLELEDMKNAFPTGQIKFAADGTMYKQFRTVGGTTFWAPSR